MNKHTPGPWKVSKRDRLYVVRADNGDYDEEAIALVYKRSLDTAETKEANARLIAAAPAILAACKAAKCFLDQLDTDHWPPALDNLIRAAVRQAEEGT